MKYSFVDKPFLTEVSFCPEKTESEIEKMEGEATRTKSTSRPRKTKSIWISNLVLSRKQKWLPL